MARIIEVVKPRKIKELQRLNVAAYARVSTGKDAMLHSLSSQVSYYSSLIQSNPSWRYIGVYADEGITGTKEDRPEFQRLLKNCDLGRIDMVITKSISRFARNTVTLLKVVRSLTNKGIDVYFEEQKLHTKNFEGEFLLTLLASFAQAESESVSDNCKWRIRKQHEMGREPNLKRLYGYHITKGILTINPKETEIVKEIFTRFASGTSALELARDLTARNIFSTRNGEWTDRKIRKLLTNEKYLGDMLLQKRFVNNPLEKKVLANMGELPKYYVRNSHPAIIDRSLFAKVQELLAVRRSTLTPKSKEKHPLYNKVICGNCHKRYVKKISRSKYFWQCHTYYYEGKASCPMKKVPETVLMDIYNRETTALEEILVLEQGRLLIKLKNNKSYIKEWAYQPERKSK